MPIRQRFRNIIKLQARAVVRCGGGLAGFGLGMGCDIVAPGQVRGGENAAKVIGEQID